jgi:hypothetical protein
LLAGDVEGVLAPEGGKAIPPLAKRVRMAKDAALGINWLHGIVNIIHRDLKPAK